MAVGSCCKKFMETNTQPLNKRHAAPNLGIVAIIFTLLFNGSLLPVTAFGGLPHFPGPWVSAETIVAFFRERSSAVLICAFLQFGGSIALGIYTATVVSRLQFLRVRAAGPWIALFGGMMTVINISIASMFLWVMAYPGVAQDGSILRAFYYLAFAFGGPGFSVPLGLLIAGVCIPATFLKLLPRWLIVFGLVLAVIGELSWFNLILPQALLLIPLTRFPGFISRAVRRGGVQIKADRLCDH